MLPEFRIRKFANAMSSNGRLSPLVTELPIVGPAARNAVDRHQKWYGGVWVGGSVDISSSGIEFQPNPVNRALTPHVSSKVIQWKDVRRVRREFGFLTGIAVVEHTHGEFRFRCFGAKGVVRKMSEYLRAL